LDGSELSPDAKRALHLLLDSAGAATNGHPDKIQAVTEVLLDTCLLNVDMRIELPAMLRAIIGGALEGHTLGCPVAQLTYRVGDKKVYPWDQVKGQLEAQMSKAIETTRPRTFLSFKWGDKTIDAGGWAAPILSIAMVAATIFYLRVTRESDIRAALEQMSPGITATSSDNKE